MKNKGFLLLSLLLAASLILAACGGGASATNAPSVEPTSGGPAIGGGSDGGSGGGSVSFDPANSTSEALPYVFEGLVAVKDGNVVGALAESYTVSDDGLDYIFNLRPGVTFHDGTALTADLVVANFNRWFDPADANRGTGEYAEWVNAFGGFKGEVGEDGKAKSKYDGIEKVNELTVLVHLNTPDADFLTKIAGPAFSIVSLEALAAGADAGSGPYTFGEATDSSVKLEPFAGYWDAAAVPSEGMEVSK